MADIIQILPDHVANQIAAGEVVQRPASALKELLENAIDAGSTSITVVAKDGGKQLLQITDNGCGMSFNDLRMAFERHATSKIKKAEDLFEIRTMGFRGEALASIASVAQVEVKTRKPHEELGSQIIIEGNKIINHDVYACPSGTTLLIKNLFYNIPARRNFLKSVNIEYSHIVEEFTRVALAYPDIEFILHHNDQLINSLPKSNFKQRIVALLGNTYKERLLHIKEEIPYVKLEGYVGKPDVAKKKRGEQYFFVNNRFIKHPFLHHAIMSAYEDIIPSGYFPAYFINIAIDPKNIDINIHPTKTEIQFDDEKTIYAVLKAAVRQIIGKFHLSPTLDFEADLNFNIPINTNRPIVEPTIHIDPSYNPFKNESVNFNTPLSKPINTGFTQDQFNTKVPSFEQNDFITPKEPTQLTISHTEEPVSNNEKNGFIQISDKYIASAVKSGIMIIDKYQGYQRIYYEKLTSYYENNKPVCQQLIFPETINFSEKDYQIIKELSEEIKKIGFDFEFTEPTTIIIKGVPMDYTSLDLSNLFDEYIEQYRSTYSTLATANRDIVLRSSSRKMAAKQNKKMNTQEIEYFIDTLFACNEPYISPSGKAIIKIMKTEEIDSRFEVL